MKWQEGAAIAGAVLKIPGADIPLKRKLHKERSKAIAKSGASHGARNFDSDIWRNEYDGGV